MSEMSIFHSAEIFPIGTNSLNELIGIIKPITTEYNNIEKSYFSMPVEHESMSRTGLMRICDLDFWENITIELTQYLIQLIQLSSNDTKSSIGSH